jgi:hypothetical protein
MIEFISIKQKAADSDPDRAKRSILGCPNEILHATKGAKMKTMALLFFLSVLTLPVLANAQVGDFNGDGQLGCPDVDALVAEIASGSNNPSFDIDGDGLVNAADLDLWLVIAGNANLPPGNSYVGGDANLDGIIDTSCNAPLYFCFQFPL